MILKPRRILLVAADSFTAERIQAAGEGREPSIDVLELAKSWGADLLSYDSLRSPAADSTLEGYAFLRGRKASLPAFPAKLQTGNRERFLLAREAWRLSKDYDAIFLTGEDLALPYAAFQCIRRTSAKCVAIGHYLNPLKKSVLLHHRLLGRFIDKFVLYSHTQHLFAQERLRFPAHKLEVIPFHADTRFYCPGPVVRRDRDLVVAAGFERRDFHVLIDAVKEVGCRLELGVGSPWSRFRRSLPELPPRCENRYRTRDELRDLYRRATAVVVPLVPTDFQAGISVALEAMACGAPIILTRTAGLEHLLQDGVDGIYVPPGDPEAVAEAIRSLQTRPDMAARMGRTARARVAGLMSTDRFIARLTWILQAACDETPNPQFFVIPSHLTARRQAA